MAIMFTCRNIFRFGLDVDRRFTLLVLNKSTDINSKVSPIKTFNTENQYLYGRLIETQKQRRATLLKRKKAQESTQNVCVSQSSNAASDIPLDDNSLKTATKCKTSKKVRVTKKSKNSDKLNKADESENLGNTRKFPLENPLKSFTVPEPIEEIKRIGINDDDVMYRFSSFPSVSKIISATMSESSAAVLKRWRLRMIAELGEEGFNTHYKAQLNRGSEFHDSIKKKLLGETVASTIEAVNASMKSLEWVWPLLTSTIAVETHIVHPQLGYRGVIDCVAKFKNTPVVVEWKLSDKPKPRLQDTYDAPVQLSAYVGALNYDTNFNFQINHGLVVVAYSSGSPADVFFLAPKHCEAYWRIWTYRLDKFNNIGHLHTEHEMPTIP